MPVSFTGGNTRDYTLGRGKLYFNGESQIGTNKGFRDLGNTPELTVKFESETKEHQNFLSGLKVIDQELLLSQKMTLSFTLDELNLNNMALFFLGSIDSFATLGISTYNASAMASNSVGVVDASLYNVYLTNINLYVWYDLALQLTSGLASLVVRAYDFEAGQIASGNVRKHPTDRNTVGSGGTVLTERTSANPSGDFELDRKMGRIRFFPGAGGITVTAPNNDILIYWAAPVVDKSLVGFPGIDAKLQRLKTLLNNGVQGSLKFIAENPVSNLVTEYHFHSITLKPDGDFSGISDDFTKLGFTATVEAVAITPANGNGSAYCNITTRDGFST